MRTQSRPLEAPTASEGCPGVGLHFPDREQELLPATVLCLGLHFPDREQWLAAAPVGWKCQLEG